MISLEQLVERTESTWVDSESGWFVFDTDEGVVLRNPALNLDHRLTDSFADGLRYSLRNQVVHPLLQTASRSLSEQLTSLLDGIREDRFRTDTDVRSGLGLNNPRQLWIEVQGSCNEQCIHCYAESAPRKLPSLDSTTVQSIVDEAAELGFSLIQFTGGDPLLWSDLPEMVQRTRDHGIEPEIYTNGLLLDEDLYEALLPARPRFAFSLYSHEAGVHDSITQKDGSWERTTEAIERALEGPTPVRVGVVIMEENRGQEEQIKKFLRGLGLDSDSINLSYLQSVGRGREYDDSESQSRSAGGTGSPAGDETGGASGSGSGHLTGERRSFNPGKLCVSYQGSVIPCIFQRDVSLGNIHQRGLRSILEDPSLGYTVNAPKDGEPSPGGPEELSCSECRFHSFMLHYFLKTEYGKSPTGMVE